MKIFSALGVSVVTTNIERLLEIMAQLRNPVGGCPWDVEQTFASIAPHTIEEAYEVVDAIERGNTALLIEELGDLLLQVVFHAQIAREDGLFAFADVVSAISEKLVRRHPHVFGDEVIADSDAQLRAWEGIKEAERSSQAAGGAEAARPSALDGIATALPALTRSHKLGARAARVGFDWPAAAPVLDKIAEEAKELRAEIAGGSGAERLTDEMGDLLFSCVNLARKLKIDPETALRHANAKFERRFRQVESLLAEVDRSPNQATPEELEALWARVKIGEREA
ncbi:MAG: nucleoside triphosphate pyrophosphohydrolase [Alphaproteobacteria bacterium]|nr:nucleoside triphosphate pyrophosphohydrolase [Alphaproteobacteria bacterium]